MAYVSKGNFINEKKKQKIVKLGITQFNNVVILKLKNKPIH